MAYFDVNVSVPSQVEYGKRAKISVTIKNKTSKTKIGYIRVVTEPNVGFISSGSLIVLPGKSITKSLTFTMPRSDVKVKVEVKERSMDENFKTLLSRTYTVKLARVFGEKYYSTDVKFVISGSRKEAYPGESITITVGAENYGNDPAKVKVKSSITGAEKVVEIPAKSSKTVLTESLKMPDKSLLYATYYCYVWDGTRWVYKTTKAWAVKRKKRESAPGGREEGGKRESYSWHLVFQKDFVINVDREGEKPKEEAEWHLVFQKDFIINVEKEEAKPSPQPAPSPQPQPQPPVIIIQPAPTPVVREESKIPAWFYYTLPVAVLLMVPLLVKSKD